MGSDRFSGQKSGKIAAEACGLPHEATAQAGQGVHEAKAKVTPKAKREMKALYTSQDVSVKDICTRYSITRSTFYRVVLERDYTAKGEA